MSSLGQQVRDIHREFAANADLQFRYGQVTRYLRFRLQKLYDADSAVRSRFPDFDSFAKAAKHAGSEVMAAERAARSREAAVASARVQEFDERGEMLRKAR